MSTGRILVADGDPAVRNFARETLGRAGWAVDACADGWEALAKYDPARHAALACAEMPRVRFLGKPFGKEALLDSVGSGLGDRSQEGGGV